MTSNIIQNLDLMLDIIKKYNTYSFVASKFTQISDTDLFVYDGKKYISRDFIIKDTTDIASELNKDGTINKKILEPIQYKLMSNMSVDDVKKYLTQSAAKIINFLEKKWNALPDTPKLTYDNTFFIVDYPHGYSSINSYNYKPEYKSKIQHIMNNFDSTNQVFASNQINDYIVNDKDIIKYFGLYNMNTAGLADYLITYKDKKKYFIALKDGFFNPNNVDVLNI